MSRAFRLTLLILLAAVMISCASGQIEVDSHKVQGHAYDFYSGGRPVRNAFALYTYVLFPDSGTESRNAALLESVFERTTPQSNTQIPEKNLNLMLIPVTSQKGTAEMTADAAVLLHERYNYGLARSILEAFCAQNRSPCGSDISQGPYILTYDSPVASNRLVPSGRWLLVDLSRIHQRAFPLFIGKFKTHLVQEEDFTERFNSIYVSLGSIVLTASDTLGLVGDGIAEIIKWFGPSD